MLWVVSALFFMFILLAELDVRPLGRGGAVLLRFYLSIDLATLSRAYLSIGSFDNTRTERTVEQIGKGHARALR
jgi:hypothetical protein